MKNSTEQCCETLCLQWTTPLFINTHIKNTFKKHKTLNKDVGGECMSNDAQKYMINYLDDFLPTSERLFCVLHLNEYLAEQGGDGYRIKKILKSYFKKVDNRIFSTRSMNKCFRYVVIENLESLGRTHVQFVISVPEHLNKHQLISHLKESIDVSKCSLEWIDDVVDLNGINDYNTKDITNRKTFAFDEVNSHRWFGRVE